MDRQSKELQIYENEKIFLNKHYIECKTILKEVDNNSINNEKLEQIPFEIYVCGRTPDLSKFFDENKNFPEEMTNNPVLKENYILLNNKNLSNSNKNISNLNFLNENIGGTKLKQNINKMNNNDNVNSNINHNNNNYDIKKEDSMNNNRNNNNNEASPTNDKVIYLDDSEEEEENNSEENKKENMNYNNTNNINEHNNVNNNNIYGQNMNDNNNLNIPLLKANNQVANNNGNINSNELNNSISGDIKSQNSNKLYNKNNLNSTINKNNENNKNLLNNDIPSFKCDKKLFYRRKIYSNKKCRYKGKDKINVQFFVGNYDKNSDLPGFIFTRDKFFYTPHNVRQLVSNTAYIISFPGLHHIYQEKIVKRDLIHVCTYYFRQKRGKQTSMDIKIKDEKTLNDGVFLNDGIINFYLKIIEDEYAHNNNNSNIDNSNNNVLIMKSYFYNSLSNQQNQNLSNNFTYPDSCSFIGTKINVFNFKTLIIPICESYHWSLIIVNDIDKMKNLFNNMLEDDYIFNNYGYNNSYDSGNNLGNDDSCEYPEIFYLDSFFDMNQRRMVIILKYLFYEYQKIYQINCDMSNFFMKNFQKIQCYIPDVPKQDNSFDCGIFLLMYAELFLFNPTYFLKNASRKYNNLYSKNENDYNKNRYDKNNRNDNNNIDNNNNDNYNGINMGNNSINTNDINNIINSGNNIFDNNMNYNNMNYNNNYNNMEQNNNNIFLNNYRQINTYENINNDNLINKNNEIENNINNQINSNNPENYIQNNNNQTIGDKMNYGNEENENKTMDQQNENNSYNYNSGYRDDLINDNSLKNWFSPELISNKRIKIKKLISELSRIEKEVNKNDLDSILKIQNTIIKNYMDEQKKEFNDYFSKLEN